MPNSIKSIDNLMCEVCDGTGFHAEMCHNSNYLSFDRDENCLFCDGMGEVELIRRHHTPQVIQKLGSCV